MYSEIFVNYLEKKINKKKNSSKINKIFNENNNIGTVMSIADGIVFAIGLGSVKLGEMVEFISEKEISIGLVLNLEFKPLIGVVAGIVSFTKGNNISEGSDVRRTYKLLSMEVS
jgi:F0F1-type ATP synthase alpha subunit